MRQQQIVMRQLDDGHEETLWRPSMENKQVLKALDVSPDGKTLAIARTLDGDNVILAIPIAGGAVREVVRLPGTGTIYQSAGFYWASDGESLFFGKSLTYGSGLASAILCRVAADGGEPQELGVTIDKLFHFSIHPDGKRIAYSTGDRINEVDVLKNVSPN